MTLENLVVSDVAVMPYRGDNGIIYFKEIRDIDKPLEQEFMASLPFIYQNNKKYTDVDAIFVAQNIKDMYTCAVFGVVFVNPYVAESSALFDKSVTETLSCKKIMHTISKKFFEYIKQYVEMIVVINDDKENPKTYKWHLSLGFKCVSKTKNASVMVMKGSKNELER